LLGWDELASLNGRNQDSISSDGQVPTDDHTLYIKVYLFIPTLTDESQLRIPLQALELTNPSRRATPNDPISEIRKI
jgi:hypothetical protein